MATSIVAPRRACLVGQSSQLDDVDKLCALSTQLSALLRMIYGEGGEAFRNKSDALQDSFLWACGDMASEIARLVDAVFSAEADHA